MENLDPRRAPALIGTLNFRDLGGYAAADGRTVRWQRLYRSGSTHGMTAEDLDRVASLGIRYVHDLRSTTERRRYPSRLPEVADLEVWCAEHDDLPGDVLRLLRHADAGPEATRALMLKLYRQMPYEFRSAYRALFAALVAGRVPLLFNCSVGKDRTGVAAALVLSALGVPRAIVREDYLLTACCYEQSCRLLTEGGDAALLAGIPASVWEPLMRADTAYLAAMFDELEKVYGSVDGYLRDQLGMDDATLARLRDVLLEGAAQPRRGL